MNIALIGNPNCGKTTLFNALTGTHQKVANWPGVTVEKKTGDFHSNQQNINITDLPGAYSLGATSDAIDEQIAREFIHNDNIDVLVNIVDASSLSRGLYLTSELAELNLPMVVVINMTDVATQHGIDIDLVALQQKLACPVIGMVAAKNRGIDELKATLVNAQPCSQFAGGGDIQRFADIDTLVNQVTTTTVITRSPTQLIDAVVLHPFFAFPIFLGVLCI